MQSIIKKGMDEYNSAFSIVENQIEFFRELEGLKFGMIKQSDLPLYTPFTSKFKIENNLDIIKTENELVFNKQLCSNLMEINFSLFEVFNISNIIKRQFLLDGRNSTDLSSFDFSLIIYLLKNRFQFDNLQKINIFINSSAVLDKFLVQDLDLSNVYLHVSTDVYQEKCDTLKSYDNIVVHVYDMDKLFLFDWESNKHSSVVYISNAESFVDRDFGKILESRILFKPIYDDNSQFFEDNVFVHEQDLLSSDFKLEEIVRNRIINYNDFGRLFIDMNGQYSTNTFINPLGEVSLDNFKEVLLNCHCSEASTWFKTRETVSPCSSCIYCELCPPITDYEHLFNKFNLCMIKDDIENIRHL